jgi:uncharacterized protein (DUF58 family)
METSEMLQKVRKIEIKARGLSQNIFAGQYHTAFKGRGMAFSEVREYQYGDDVRDIDWNVTARFHHPYVKVFEEERELTVMLLVDVSGSLDFGTTVKTKRELATEIAATLAFSAIQNNDKIGVVFFSDHIEKYIPPKKGRKHILYIIREMLNFRAESSRTNVTNAVEFLTRVMKRRCTAFLLSDFYERGIGEGSGANRGRQAKSKGSERRAALENALLIANKKHDFIALQIYDRRAKDMPDVGLVKVRDAETGHEMFIDTSDSRLRRAHADYWNARQTQLQQIFSKSNIDSISVSTNDDYVKSLMLLFAKRT